MRQKTVGICLALVAVIAGGYAAINYHAYRERVNQPFALGYTPDPRLDPDQAEKALRQAEASGKTAYESQMLLRINGATAVAVLGLIVGGVLILTPPTRSRPPTQ